MSTTEIKFYNDEQKRAWVDTLKTRDDSYVKTIFSSASIHEQINGKDLCNFSKTLILNFYKSLMSTSVDRLYNTNSFLKTYTDWCLLNEAVEDKQNHYTEIEYNDLTDCINTNAIKKKYITRNQLLGWSNNGQLEGIVVNPCDLAVIWLLFEGVRGEHYSEILNVEYGDFDVEKHTVRLGKGDDRRELKLSKECVDFVLSTRHVSAYVLPSLIEKSFIDDKILRSYRKDQVDRENKSEITMVNQLNRRIVKALNTLGIKNSSLNSIIVSGQIDFIKQLVKRNKMDIEEYIISKECYDALHERYQVGAWIGKKFYAVHKDRLKEESE